MAERVETSPTVRPQAARRLDAWLYALRTTNPPAGRVDPVTRWLVVTRAGVLPLTLFSGLLALLLAADAKGHKDWSGLALAIIGILASIIMLGFGLWWLGRAEAAARRVGEGYGGSAENAVGVAADDQFIRERATNAREFDPAEIRHGRHGDAPPPIGIRIGAALIFSSASPSRARSPMPFCFLLQTKLRLLPGRI